MVDESASSNCWRPLSSKVVGLDDLYCIFGAQRRYTCSELVQPARVDHLCTHVVHNRGFGSQYGCRENTIDLWGNQ